MILCIVVCSYRGYLFDMKLCIFCIIHPQVTVVHARDQSKLKLQKKGSCGVVVNLLCDLLLSNLIFLFFIPPVSFCHVSTMMSPTPRDQHNYWLIRRSLYIHQVAMVDDH